MYLVLNSISNQQCNRKHMCKTVLVNVTTNCECIDLDVEYSNQGENEMVKIEIRGAEVE